MNNIRSEIFWDDRLFLGEDGILGPYFRHGVFDKVLRLQEHSEKAIEMKMIRMEKRKAPASNINAAKALLGAM